VGSRALSLIVVTKLHLYKQVYCNKEKRQKKIVNKELKVK
jgi:hypothetical protein